MDTKNEDQAQIDARAKAALLLRDRHERESEALAALMAAVSRRAMAEEIVERETEQIASRLAEMARLGFDEAELTALGIDVADVHVTRASGTGKQPAPGQRPRVGEPHVGNGKEGDPDDGETTAQTDAGVPVAAMVEHPAGVRTTAHLGSLPNAPAAATLRPWSRIAGRVEPDGAPTA